MPKAQNPFPRDPPTLVAEILMLRASDKKKSFFLVEGISDQTFWKPFCIERLCEILQCNGKNNVLKVVELLEGDGRVHGFLGLVDDDLDTLEGRTLPSSNLVKTHTHDLEMILLTEEAIENVLAEYGDTKKADAFASDDRSRAQGILQALLQGCSIFGRLRWLARRKGWSEKNISVWKYTLVESWLVNEEDLVKMLAQENNLAVPDLHTLLAGLPVTSELRLLCQGHDAIDFLVIGLTKKLGEKGTTKDKLEVILRSSFSFEHLDALPLRRAIHAWEAAHPPFQILRPLSPKTP